VTGHSHDPSTGSLSASFRIGAGAVGFGIEVVSPAATNLLHSSKTPRIVIEVLSRVRFS
jgi:hypothetical protein